MFGGRYEPLVDGGVALGTVVTVGTDGVMNPFWRFVDTVELFELGFGSLVVGEVF